MAGWFKKIFPAIKAFGMLASYIGENEAVLKMKETGTCTIILKIDFIPENLSGYRMAV